MCLFIQKMFIQHMFQQSDLAGSATMPKIYFRVNLRQSSLYYVMGLHLDQQILWTTSSTSTNESPIHCPQIFRCFPNRLNFNIGTRRGRKMLDMRILQLHYMPYVFVVYNPVMDLTGILETQSGAGSTSTWIT